MKLPLTALAVVAACMVARAEPVAITASQVPSFHNLSAETEFGALSWRGGLSLASADKNFGGLSGLALSNDCQNLLAVSDAGRWFRATLTYEGAKLAGIADAELAPILDGNGKPPRSKVRGDAEALAAFGRGRYLVGFERRTRIGIYDIAKDGLEARFQPLKSPKEIAAGPDNKELEALGAYAGTFIAISENSLDGEGNLRAWMWGSKRTLAFSLKRFEDYQITDLAVEPDGGILVLERSLGTLLPGMAIRRFAYTSIGEGVTVEPEVLFSGRAPIYAIDNMEGIALCRRGGETLITLVSDNNFNTNLQRTLLLQFAYEPE